MNRLFTRPHPLFYQRPILSITVRLSSDSKISPLSKPSPPPLGDAEEQREFEQLVREKQGPARSSSAAAVEEEEEIAHPDLRRKPPPEFEGDKNPVTGEIGGPKQDPLLHGDWSYGSRVTDF